MKTYGGVEVWLHYSWPGRCNPPGRAPSTDLLGGWVGPGTGLDAVENIIFSGSCQESNPISSAVQRVVHRYTDWANTRLSVCRTVAWLVNWNGYERMWSWTIWDTSVKWNEGVRKTRKRLSQDIRCFGRDSKWKLPAYESLELPVCQTA
jgi:hypothetical protein